MKNFIYNIKTKIFFGDGQIKHLPSETLKYGKKVLLLYGKNSIKKMGLYDEVMKLYNEAGIEVIELSGVNPNPRLSTVLEGKKLCQEHNIELILAAGGGSVIDCAKAIAVAAKNDLDIWKDVYVEYNMSKVKDAIPIATILTLAATGTEMNANSVISNHETEEKYGTAHRLMKPKFSILDPKYTFSVSSYQTAAGSADILSHLFEQYFTPDKEGFLQARMAEAIMKTVIEYAPIAVENPDNYEARANLMWSSTMALNSTISSGQNGDWSVHAMEHELSAKYDITHGVGLAILTPRWMEYVLTEENVHRFVDYGKNVWGIEGEDEFSIAREAISNTHEFFLELNIPITLREVGIDESRLDEMAKASVRGGSIGAMRKLGPEDVLKIFKASL